MTSLDVKQHVGSCLAAIVEARPDSSVIDVPDGERAKTMRSLSSCWRRLLAEGFTRNDCLVTLGGGSVSDLGGFVAATFKRGMHLVHVPTTLMGQVDAAIGGKNGVNAHGVKNAIGTVYEPRLVVIDPSFNETLSLADLRSGMAEVVKCGYVGDPSLLDACDGFDLHRPAGLDALIAKSVAVKLSLVKGDELDHGKRRYLNYGHTLGHALESIPRLQLRHGEAVALGMIFAAELGDLLNLSSGLRSSVVDRLARLGLSTTLRRNIPYVEVATRMAQDKKRGGKLGDLVLCRAPGQPMMHPWPASELCHAAYRLLQRSHGRHRASA